MTMATINVLLGIVSIFFSLAVALGALTYAVAGIRCRGFLRRWNVLIAVVLGAVAWGSLANAGQDFARASESTLLSHPADAGGLIAVVLYTLLSSVLLVAGVTHLLSLRRSSAART